MVAPSSTVLDSILDPVADCLDPESARRLLNLELEPLTRRRIDDLAGRAVAGQLTDKEKIEYADYVEAIDLVGILQAKARQVLARAGQ